MTPRFSPRGDKLVYVGYIGRRPRVLLYDVASGTERLLIPATTSPSLRASRLTARMVFSMANGGNTDIYIVSAERRRAAAADQRPGRGYLAQLLTRRPPDRVRKRPSGTQQLYVMGSDGSNQRRISFGGGRYASPTWSPAGDLIAFTKIAGPFRIGVMNPAEAASAS